MVKRILYVALALAILFLVLFNLHNYFITEPYSFSLLQVYIFHAIAVLIVYIGIELVADIMPNQAGYAYLMLMFFKIGLFVLIFQTSVFGEVSLTQPERIGLVVPLFIFLIVEALAVGKLLNSK